VYLEKCISGPAKVLGTLRAVKEPDAFYRASATNGVEYTHDFGAEINMLFFLSQPRVSSFSSDIMMSGSIC
jgi:hypothetical protein